MSAARQRTHTFLTAPEYDLQLNYRGVIPITGVPVSPAITHQFHTSQSLSSPGGFTVTETHALFPQQYNI